MIAKSRCSPSAANWSSTVFWVTLQCCYCYIRIQPVREWPSGVNMCKLRMSNIKGSSVYYQGSHVPAQCLPPGYPASMDPRSPIALVRGRAILCLNIRRAPPVAYERNHGAHGHLSEVGGVCTTNLNMAGWWPLVVVRLRQRSGDGRVWQSLNFLRLCVGTSVASNAAH